MIHMSENVASSESDVIKKIVSGEQALFEVLIRRYNGVLYKIARSYGFNHHEAEDLMQDTHVAAFEHLGQFAFKSTYKTWLSKIMINKCLYRLKHGYTMHEQPASNVITEDAKPMSANNKSKSPEQFSLNRELAKALENALQAIPLHYRSVFVLREIEGFSVAETATLLDLSEVNVKVRLNRAKIMLQKELSNYYSTTSLYDFNLVYCDKVVENVMSMIKQ